MTRCPLVVPALLAVGAAAVPAMAQSNVDPAHKYAWSENLGWTNWADANGGAQGVRVNATYLQGYIWSENAGWISVGDGTPGGGGSYSNASGADHGVNILPNGDLEGFAWGENIGWINFGTAPTLGGFGQQARIDWAAGRFRGWAWGENVGWINLDDGTHFVGIQLCYADCNGDGTLSVADFTCFRNAYLNGDTSVADCTGDGALTVADFTCFRNAYLAGCP